jgi:TRAP-type C4-dicarboxylate transport system substrate-binding protein
MRMAVILVVAAAFAGLSSGASADQYRLKLHHLLPPVAFAHTKMLVPWARKVEKDSGGRIKIDIYPSMHLGGQPPQLVDQVREGVVDLVWTLPGYTPGRFPRIEVFELPFLNTHPAVMNLAIQDFIDHHPEEFAEYKMISVFVHAGQAIHSKVPIRTVDDLRGLKLRIPTRVAGWMVEAWGAVPVGTPVQKIPEMLSKGIVDGALIPFEVAYGLKIHDLVKYHILLDNPASDRFNTQVLMIAMNRESYERLPPDLQAVIDKNSGRNIALWMARVWMNSEKPGEAAARETGEFIYLPPPEVEKLRAMTQSQVAERWISTVAKQGIDGRALVEEAKRLIEHYRQELRRRGILPGEAARTPNRPGPHMADPRVADFSAGRRFSRYH